MKCNRCDGSGSLYGLGDRAILCTLCGGSGGRATEESALRFRSLMNAAFLKLRKAGYIARKNFRCCTTCASNALASMWEEKFGNKEYKVVYYHKQAADRIPYGCNVWLGWDGDGKEISRILEKSGLDVEWNGTTSQKIRVSLPW